MKREDVYDLLEKEGLLCDRLKEIQCRRKAKINQLKTDQAVVQTNEDGDNPNMGQKNEIRTKQKDVLRFRDKNIGD